MKVCAVILFLVLILQSVPGVATESRLKKVSLLPQWLPQAQFAGYMVALEKGFYKEAGLDLTLIEGGPDKPPFVGLWAGEATFCTGWLSNAIEKKASGMPMFNLGQIIQRSALVLVARKAAGVTVPKDLAGRKVGLWAGQFYLQPFVFFSKYDLGVTVVPNYSSVGLFLKGGVDACAAMWYNEYHTLLNSGFNPDELTLFFFSDLGLNFPEDGLYCLEDTYNADPQMCAAFVEASLKGWLYAFAHKDEALEIVMKRAEAAHTGTNMAHQRWMLDRMQDIIFPKGRKTELGKLDPKDYAGVAEVLEDFHYIDHIPPFADFYRGPR